tara:strand:+ start:126 stop:500 length:375 start_codon:yes stop_codon:yes gene_type:complete
MNKYTQDMTGTGQHIELPDPGPEPERYYDWMLWKLRQSPKWKKAIHSEKTEFQTGIFEVVKNFLKDDSLALAAIFFVGHVIIAMAVVSIITGASFWEAGAVALIEPAVNSLWFYALHKLWKKFK